MYGDTPLNLACSTHADNCVPILIEAGADPHIPNEFGANSLHTCIRQASVVCLDILYTLCKTLNPYLRTKYGYNNMELACSVE